MGLVPGYKKIKNAKGVSRSGFTSDFLKSIMEGYSLWQRPMSPICQKANQLKVKDIMYTPEEEEYIHGNSSLNEAIHQLIMGRHPSLLVLEDKKISGILRLSALFHKFDDVF